MEYLLNIIRFQNRHFFSNVAVKYSLEKELPSTFLQGNTFSTAVISQEINTLGSRFFPVNKYSFGK